MKLFKTDPVAALGTEQAALLQVESNIIKLENERAAAIESTEGDVVAAVLKLEGELKKQHQTAAVHRDRIAVIQRQCREQERQRLEQEKAAGIADVRKRLTKRHEAARKLDAALKQVAEAFAELMRVDEEAFFNFPPSVSPLGGLAHFRLEAFEPLSAHIRQRPRSAGQVRAIAEHEPPFNFADAIEARNGEVIEMLESAPIGEPELAA